MVNIDVDKRDKLDNALIVGMSIEDAYIYAGLTPNEIEAVSADDEEQRHILKRMKSLEFNLLNRMEAISVIQAAKGREAATAWLLEKLYPRYADKPKAEVGEIHLHFSDDNLDEMDTVEIHADKE